LFYVWCKDLCRHQVDLDHLRRLGVVDLLQLLLLVVGLVDLGVGLLHLEVDLVVDLVGLLLHLVGLVVDLVGLLLRLVDLVVDLGVDRHLEL